jgi:anaerobic dimethyl sulfoxide reductase subunit C (anchor subunit)
MNTREWALIVFTTLAQLSVGMLFVLLIVRRYISRALGAEKAAAFTDTPLYAVPAIMVLALIASLFHLGKIMNVIGVIPNLATSWMSREVVFSVTFTVLTVVFAFLEWRKIGSEGLRMALGWLAAIVGILLLSSMSATYMLPAQPAWNTPATPIGIFATALLLGILGSTAGLVATTKARAAEAADQVVLKAVLKGSALAAVFLLGIELLILPMYIAYLSTQGLAALRSIYLMATEYGALLFLRLLLVFIGAGVLAFYLYQKASVEGGEKSFASLAYSAFALVFVSELLGRVLFYATHYRIGV